MAVLKDAEVEEDGGEQEKLCAYKLVKDFGDHKPGDTVHLPESVGEALVKLGHAELASAEDLRPGDDEDDGDEIIANAADKLAKQVEKRASIAVAKEINKANKVRVEPMAATVNTEKPFRSNGHYIRTLIDYKIKGKRDTQTLNRIAAYERQAADYWRKRLPDAPYDDVMLKTAPLGINETTSSQGGYLVNPEYSADVYAIPHGQINLQEMAMSIEAKSNIYNQRYVNESSLVNGSIYGGLNLVATTEGNSFSSSLPAWNNLAFTLQKLAVFVYYTMEVLQDASYPIEQELNEYAYKTALYGINTQIVQGSTIEGVLNTPGLVTVTKSSNDTAYHTTPSTSLTYADLAAMWSRVYADCQSSPKGIWLFHPSLVNPLTQMTYSFSTGGVPAWGITYNAEKGLSGLAWDTPYYIFGKPAYTCWACSAPGTAGDILYIDFATVKRYFRPTRIEISRDFQFGTDQVACRWVDRLDEKTIFRNAVTGPTGTDTFSACVTRSSSGT